MAHSSASSQSHVKEGGPPPPLLPPTSDPSNPYFSFCFSILSVSPQRGSALLCFSDVN